MDPLTELLDWTPSNIPPRHWPHKCDKCGRFVSHETLQSGTDGFGQGEYWATAECGNCGRRRNVNPV